MTTKSQIRPKPEDEELKQKTDELASLEKQLVENELKLISLRRELGAFHRLYVQKVGALYAELDDIDAQIAEFLAEHAPSDVDARNMARDARALAEESKASVAQINVKESTRFSTPSSLKSLYREVAKRIHPDLTVEQGDRIIRHRLMAEANEAYENGDEARLLAILEEYESSPDTVLGDGTGAELIRVIRKIAQVKRRLLEIDRELRDISNSELALLKRKVDDGEKHGRDVLNEIANTVKLRIERGRASLRKMAESRSE
jgi:uncharacterized coiled-coil DUF342 family protein